MSIFRTVYEYGSVSRAAAALNLTQPAVSAQLRRLEQDVDTPLFERRGREIKPTQGAELLYRFACSILDARRDALERLAEYKAGRRGRLRVGASTTGVIYYLPPLLYEFGKRHPEVETAVRAAITDQIREAVAADAVDVGLIWGPVTDPRLVAETLGYDDFAVVCHPRHPLARFETAPADALADQRFILPPAATTTRKFIEARLRDIGIIPNVAMELDTTEAMKRVVEGNLGIAVISGRAAADEFATGRLRRVAVAGIDLKREMNLIWRKERELIPAALSFIELTRRFPLIETRETRP